MTLHDFIMLMTLLIGTSGYNIRIHSEVTNTSTSSKNAPKEMFDALTNIFEGKNVNRRMTLRN